MENPTDIPFDTLAVNQGAAGRVTEFLLPVNSERLLLDWEICKYLSIRVSLAMMTGSIAGK